MIDWLLVTFVTAVAAVVVNGSVAAYQWRHRDGFPLGAAWAAVLAWTAVFALFYAGSFGLLYWGHVNRAEWSVAMTPFASVSFATIWTTPALLAFVKIRHYRRLGRALAEQGAP